MGYGTLEIHIFISSISMPERSINRNVNSAIAFASHLCVTLEFFAISNSAGSGISDRFLILPPLKVQGFLLWYLNSSKAQQ